MPPNNPKQRVIEINQRINALGRERRLAEALALLPQLRSQGLKPTAVTFNVLLNACSRCGDNARAATLLDEMRTDGLKPNLITFATVAKGLSQSGELQRAEQVLELAESQGVEINARVCSAFLRGCLVHGEVDRVLPFVQRMTGRWRVGLDSASAEYAARGLCMGLQAAEAEQVLATAARTASGGSVATDGEGGGADGGSAALHLALAEAHAALLDWPNAKLRLRRARERIASGLDTRLHADRDEQWEGGNAQGHTEREGEQLSSFLRHREAEQKDELARLERLVAAHDGGGSHGNGGATSDGGVSDDDDAEAKRAQLRRAERSFGRVVLLSAATAKLAATPIEAAVAGAAVTPKKLRRWRLAALLAARLDRLGLGRLQRRCCGGGGGGLGPTSLIDKSEKRVVKRLKRACSAKSRISWRKIFGNNLPVRLEVCAGAGDWAIGQAKAHAGAANVVASEIRGDRIHQIVTRMRTAGDDGLPNLAVLGGDASLALRRHTRPRCFDAIYVNFPEPPSDHSNADDYLLNRAFFVDAFAALQPGGLGLIIVSDNPNVLETAADTLRGLMRGGSGSAEQPLAYAPRSGVDAGWPAVTGVAGLGRAGAALVSEGTPDGFGADGTSSWFDRLWASRSKKRRFHIHMVRES